MKQYEVHMIVGASTVRRSPNHIAGGLKVDLNRLQGMLGDGWTLLSVVEGPQPNSYVTVWVTV